MPCASSSCGGHGAAKRANEARQLKDAGNELFGAKRYADAIAKYAAAADAAFEADDREIEAIAHSNAAQAHLMLEAYDDAVMAATLALAADPTLGKALVRRAKARAALGNKAAAKEDAEELRRRLPELKGVTGETVTQLEVELGIRAAAPKPAQQQQQQQQQQSAGAALVASATPEQLEQLFIQGAMARAMSQPFVWNGVPMDLVAVCARHLEVQMARGSAGVGDESCSAIWGTMAQIMRDRGVPSVTVSGRAYDVVECCARAVECDASDVMSWQVLGTMLRDGPDPARTVPVRGEPISHREAFARAALAQRR